MSTPKVITVDNREDTYADELWRTVCVALIAKESSISVTAIIQHTDTIVQAYVSGKYLTEQKILPEECPHCEETLDVIKCSCCDEPIKVKKLELDKDTKVP